MRPLALVVLSLLAAAPVAAQASLRPELGALTPSMGQPTRWRPLVGLTGGAQRRDRVDSLSILLRVGAERLLIAPSFGGLAARVEGYAGSRVSKLDGGARAQLTIPILGLGFGYDWNARDRQADGLISLGRPLRRGGPLGRGSAFQLDYLPGRGHTLLFGFDIPLTPWAGETRPRNIYAPLPDRRAIPPAPIQPGPEQVAASSRLAEQARLLTRAVTPRLEGDHADRLGDPAAATTEWHRLMDAAFVAALGDAAPHFAARVGVKARELLLEHVLLPYDRLLGQRKRAEHLGALAATAESEFESWYLGDESPNDRLPLVREAYRQVLAAVEAAHADGIRRWRDGRRVWLPLQLALRPDQHDTQGEIDALVERVTRESFGDGNRLWWVVNGQFHVELGRQIRQARQYHVLWIHDYAGRNDRGLPDSVSFGLSTRGYLAALLDGVRAYDRRGTIPSFHIFLDQHFYEPARGRFWLDLLEHPLSHRMRFPGSHQGMARVVEAYQDSLRQAVAASQLLTTRRRTYGEDWLQDQVRVHVSITNPLDPSFWGPDVLPVVGIPDASIRDHRKIAFRDASEDDPYQGSVIFTGMGVGEHYAGPTWEDRAVLIEGPATLETRDAALQMLREQGIRAEELPWALRSRPRSAAFEAAVTVERARMAQAGQLDARVMELHAGTGYLDKVATAAVAAFLTLMPQGSVLKLPDSLWQSEFMGSLATGAALRGCRVLVIAPSLRAAPSAGWPQMAGAWLLLSRLLTVEAEGAAAMRANGGMLKVGLYDEAIGVGDLRARAVARARNLEQTPWLHELMPFDSTALGVWSGADSLFARYPNATYLAGGIPDAQPKLHLKGMFLASREGWDGLLARPELAAVLRAYIVARFAQVSHAPDAVPDIKALPRQVEGPTRALFDAHLAALTPAQRERISYYLTAGSRNMDDRSLVQNGEVMLAVSGRGAIRAFVDFLQLAAQTTWVSSQAELDALLPRPPGWKQAIARWIAVTL